MCRPQGSLTDSPPVTDLYLSLQSHLLFVAVEILEVLVVVEGHVPDGMYLIYLRQVPDGVVLALLVGGVHDGVGGMGEMNKVTAVLQGFYYLPKMFYEFNFLNFDMV